MSIYKNCYENYYRNLKKDSKKLTSNNEMNSRMCKSFSIIIFDIFMACLLLIVTLGLKYSEVKEANNIYDYFKKSMIEDDKRIITYLDSVSEYTFSFINRCEEKLNEKVL